MTKSINLGYEVPYQFDEDQDLAGHFWFPKALVEDGYWSCMSPAAKSVYPVIGTHFNKEGRCFPGERTIAIQAGYTDKQARKGINDLDQCPAVDVIPYVTSRGRRSKKYQSRSPENSKRAFPFHNAICKGGSWSQLRPTSKALYPVIRNFSFFDHTVALLYSILENFDFPDDLKNNYSSRPWDFCEAEPDVLAEYAGISEKSLPSALHDLERVSLIEPCPADIVGLGEGWKVLLRPRKFPDTVSLNEKILKRYKFPNPPLEKSTA